MVELSCHRRYIGRRGGGGGNSELVAFNAGIVLHLHEVSGSNARKKQRDLTKIMLLNGTFSEL